MIINGNVCDLTPWISQHPGGPEKILKLCGKDGSSDFENQHKGQEKPKNTLDNFYIGKLTY